MTTEQAPPDEAAILAKLRHHIRILVDLGRLAGETHGAQRFLDQAVVQVARAVEVDHVKVLRYRRQTADLFMEAGMGWKDGVVRAATFPSGFRSAPGRSFLTGEPVVIVDTAAPGDVVISDVLSEHGIRSLANVPLLHDGAAWGVLEVDSSVRRDFSEDTVEFLTAAAAIIGPASQRADASRAEAEAVAAAAAAAHSREVLLREMQHRVKNNFQLILASVSMQKRRFDNAEVHRVLDHVASRITAISLAHDQLSPRQDAQAVDVAAYLRTLCASVEQQVDGIAIEVEADEVALAIDRAVPLGLILNETVTNSVKHAFGPEGGRIAVKLTAGIGYGEARLVVTDNGHGIRNPRPNGSGQKLIAALARQIGGELDQATSAQGTTTTVTFPVIV